MEFKWRAEEGGMVTNRAATMVPAWFAVLLAGIGALSGCAGPQQVVAVDDVPNANFRVVATEEVGLNGVENEGRPPIRFLLLTADDDESSERELVQRYVDSARADGWDLVPYEDPDAWWTFVGSNGDGIASIGPASRFVELATIEEGTARTRFRAVVAEESRPLIVVSIEP